jgi:pimeloyl-ACP methyl ester carboxylesterase
VHRPAIKTSLRTAAGRWWPLALVASVIVTLTVGGVLPRWAGLIHSAAVPPLDLALDLRVLVARAPSYPAFLIGVAASVTIRTAILASLLAAVGARPSFGGAVARAARVYVAALVPMAVAAGLEFAGLAAGYAWYGWAGLGLTLVTAVTLTSRWLAPRGVRMRRIADVVGYLVALSVLGALTDLAGPWAAPVGVVASAALTAVTLARLARPAPRRRAARWPGTWGRASAAAAILALSAVSPRAHAPPQAARSEAVLLIVPGVDTSSGSGAAYRLDPATLGFPCDRVFYYSYRGPGEGAPAGEARCPIRLHRPYADAATQRPLAELVAAFADQVAAIRTEVGPGPLVVVTHSQGAVIAWRAAAEDRAPGITHLIGLAGLPHSAVGYPPPRHNGPGRVGADALRMLSWASRFLDIGSFDPDAPLARELLAGRDGLEAVFEQPLPSGVTAALVFATGDLIVAPEGHELPGGRTVTIDTTHVGIVESPDAAEAVRSILAGGEPGGGSPFAAFLDPFLQAWLPPPAGV